jgi:hypothetical protein
MYKGLEHGLDGYDEFRDGGRWRGVGLRRIVESHWIRVHCGRWSVYVLRSHRGC